MESKADIFEANGDWWTSIKCNISLFDKIDHLILLTSTKIIIYRYNLLFRKSLQTLQWFLSSIFLWFGVELILAIVERRCPCSKLSHFQWGSKVINYLLFNTIYQLALLLDLSFRRVLYLSGMARVRIRAGSFLPNLMMPEEPWSSG